MTIRHAGVVGIFTTTLAFGTLSIVSAQAPGVKGAAPVSELPPHGYVITKSLPGTDSSVDYTFVLTRDEIYVPIAVRRPKGNGPFPAITMASGEGKAGMQQVERLVARLAPMQDRILARGYVVATINYRNEIPYFYETLNSAAHNLSDNISGGQRTLKSDPTLDHEDLIAIIKYLQSLPYVDKDAVGAVGVSHSGEMILKASSEYTFGAGVSIEGAAHEFLKVNTGPTAPRKEGEIQYNDVEVARRNADKAFAMARIRKMNTPILHIGRDTDHQEGIFRLVHEWMKEAGKDSTWVSFDHPVHGFPFIYKKADGSYQPDPIQQKAFDTFMDFFDKHLKHSHKATAQ